MEPNQPADPPKPRCEGPAPLMILACLTFLISMVLCVTTSRALYDDGSYYFVRVLQAGGFTEMLFHRSFAAYLFQLPVVMAFKLGITDMDKLRVAFGIGCFCAWPIAMAMCWRLARKYFWLVALACGAGYLNAAFVAVGEHVVAHAFFWPVCFVIFFVRPLTWEAAGMLLISTAILLRSYESMLFIGPLLAGLTFWRAAVAEKSWERIVFLLATFLLACSTWVGLDGTLHPCTLSNVGSFTTGIKAVLAEPGWTIGWTTAWLVLMLAAWLPPVQKIIRHPVAIAALGGVILLWGAWPFLSPATLDPYKQYEARFMDLVIPLALLPVAALLAYRPQWLEARRRYFVNLSAGLLLAQSLWHVAATEQWRGYLNVWRELLATRKGIVNLQETPYGKYPAVGHQATRFVWVMDALNMCVEIGPRKVDALILPDPYLDGAVNGALLSEFAPKALPNLDRYGVDYSEYIRVVGDHPETNFQNQASPPK